MDSWFASDAPLRKKGQEVCHYSNWSILPVNIPYLKKKSVSQFADCTPYTKEKLMLTNCHTQIFLLWIIIELHMDI